MDLARRGKRKCVVLKADFEKAYDSVSWAYLEYMLRRMGFGEQWRKWMKTCVSSNSISVLCNGGLSDEFVAHKGLKQGDPLSPFLFLVAAEGLAGLVRMGVESNNLQGFKLSDEVSVTLLQFADDTIFFCDGGDRSIWCLKAVLRSFELVSGLKVNFSKSNVIGISLDERMKEGISQFLACNLGEASFKFLGIPVGANPRRSSTWQPVIDSLKARLNLWRSRQLSMGGRVALINSVLASLPLYLFSFYKAPRKVLDEIKKIQRRFLWGGDETERKMAWVKWETICLQKEKGGLGVKNLEAFNISLLTKWRWRLLSEETNSLWKVVVSERYGLHGRWPSENEFRQRWSKHSLWWRDLCLLGEGTGLDNGWFEGLVTLKLGRGNLVRFWLDRWLGTETFATLFPSLFGRCTTQNFVIDQMGAWTSHGWVWNLHREADVSLESDENWLYLQDMLTGVSPIAGSDDKWCWTAGSNAAFSVKSCYSSLSLYFAGDGVVADASVLTACPKLWRNDVPSKVLIFTWRVFLNRIATRDALLRRGILLNEADAGCGLCVNNIESAEHLFLHCKLAKEVWSKIEAWLGESLETGENIVDNFLAFGKMVKGKTRRGVKHLVWLATVWKIWSVRNKLIFSRETETTSEIVLSIKHCAWSWFKARKGRNCMVSWSDWYLCPMGCLSLL